MAISRRRRLNQVTPHSYPKLPLDTSKWPPGLEEWANAVIRTLQLKDDIAFGIQDNGTDMPLRAILDLIGASVTDDQTNDRTQVSIGGGAGAAPVNATYLVVSLNGTLTAERVLVAGTGLTSTDGGANGNFTVLIANTAVTPATYGSATQVGQFTVNQQGQITGASNVSISYPPSSWNRTYLVMGA
jgi:hypothetical protein